MCLFASPGEIISGNKNSMPDDVPSLELFIQIHKDMVAAEKLAVLELTAIQTEHVATRSLAYKYNATRNILNEKLADVCSYITLASRIASLALQVKSVGENYYDFTKYTVNNVKENPLIAGIYASACKKAASNLKILAKQTATMVLQQTNILKATMEEKHRYLNDVSSRLTSIKMIIWEARHIMRLYDMTKQEIFDGREFVKSGTYKKCMSGVIDKWNKKTI